MDHIMLFTSKPLEIFWAIISSVTVDVMYFSTVRRTMKSISYKS